MSVAHLEMAGHSNMRSDAACPPVPPTSFLKDVLLTILYADIRIPFPVFVAGVFI